MLDFRIQTFLTLAREKSYTETANKLFITQPAVTQHIQYLERQFGVKLTASEGKKFKLTAAGEYLYRQAETMETDAKKISREIRSMGGAENPLRVGATMTVGEFLMPDLLKNLTEKKRSFTFTMANTATLTELLLQGAIDCAFTEGYLDRSLVDAKIIKTEPLVAVGNPSEFTEETYPLETLFSKTLILREKGSGTRDVLERHLQEFGYGVDAFQNVIECENIGAIKRLVASGIGITFLYEMAVDAEVKSGALKKLSVAAFRPEHPLSFIIPRGSRYSAEYLSLFFG